MIKKRRILEQLRIIAIALAIILTGFSMNRLEAGAVGIFVDEDATSVGSDSGDAGGEDTPDPGDVDADSQEDTGTEGSTPEGTDSTPEDTGSVPEDTENTEQQPGGNPAAPWLWEVGTGETDMHEAMIERQLGLSSDKNANTLDISKGNITLRKGGDYTQIIDGIEHPGKIADEQFTIVGTTGQFYITVEPEASPTINVSGMSINLTGNSSAMNIKSGANVVLVLGSQPTVLQGGDVLPGITLEEDASLAVKGEGKLNVIGGAAGGYGICGADKTKGGTLQISDMAQFAAYSGQNDGACYTNVSAVSKRILQGTLTGGAVGDPSTKIKAENRDDPAESYEMDIPKGYRSFAVSTSAVGGYYVSYYPEADTGNIVDSTLLVSEADGGYTYNLEGVGNTFASRSGLVPQKVNCDVILNANGGLFNNGNVEKTTVSVPYGQTITLPTKDEVTRNEHTLRDWYKVKDSIAEGDLWVPSGRVVVDKMNLYATWQPNTCIVNYESDGDIVLTKEYDYEDTIPSNEKWEPGPDFKKGYTLAYFTGPDGKEWVFGEGGTKLLRGTTTLKAKWLANCTVKFESNSGSEKIDGWPLEITTPATRTIAPPDVTTLLRDKFSFTGKWYTSKNGTEEWNFDTDTVTRNMSLYAGWGAKVTKVFFNVNEDAEQKEHVDPQDVEVNFGNRIPKPTATKDKRIELPTDFELEGWYTSKNLKPDEKWNFNTELIDADGKLDLYAKWDQTLYWAILQSGTETKEEIPKEVPNGGSLKSQYGTTLDSLFKKEGHKITGWKETRTNKKWDIETVLTKDISLTALWEPQTFTMTFETPEGAPSMPEGQGSRSVVYNRTTDAPKYGTEETAWPGHTFQGWYMDSSSEPEAGTRWKFAGEQGADPMPAEDVTLYAYWTADEYRVSFHTFTGDLEENKIPDQFPVLYGEHVTEPPAPVRNHYDFLGWFSDKELTNKWDFAKDTVTGDMMLSAGWNAHPIEVVLHVKYESENKDHPDEVIEIPYSGKVFYGDYLDQAALESLEHTTARPGFTLNGWYTDENYTEEGKWDFANVKAEPETERIDLYAYWTWDDYTVDFHTWDGDTQVPPITEVRHGQKIPRPDPDPVRNHYVFDNWYADLEAAEKVPWDFDKDVVTGDMTLYANWIPNRYTLSFETNGGTKLDPIEINYGEHIPSEALQTERLGYRLTGWFRDKELTQPFVPGTDFVDGNITIYAAWELEKYTVTFHFMEAEDSTEEETITYKDAYEAGDYLTKPDKKIPHKTLSGWYKTNSWSKEDQWLFKRDRIEGDTELYAYWSDTLYNVHYETAGGAVIEDQKLPWGTQLERPKDPEHPGGTFDGWYKDSDFSTPWNFEEDFVEGDTVIYAKWILNMCTVTFEADGGLPVPDVQVLPYGSLIAEPAPPAKEGFTFAGWMANGGIWDFAARGIEGDTLLIAQWEPIVPVDPTNPDDPANDPKNPTGRDGGGNQQDPATNRGSGTDNNNTNTADADAKKALADAANELKKILTGDKAPLTYILTGIFLSAGVIIGVLRKKYRR